MNDKVKIDATHMQYTFGFQGGGSLVFCAEVRPEFLKFTHKEKISAMEDDGELIMSSGTVSYTVVDVEGVVHTINKNLITYVSFRLIHMATVQLG